MNNRILVVDDHPAICMAIKFLLASEGFDIVAETGNGADGLALVEVLRPSTMILDIGIPTVDGLTVINKVVAKQLPVKIIVLTGLPSVHLKIRCRQMGVHGFVSKQNELSDLVHAVRAVRANEEYFPGLPSFSRCQDGVIDEYELLNRLSTREFRVMQLLVQGMCSNDIADCMLLSKKTVSTYKKRLFLKLNVGSLVDLYALAKRNGLA